MIWPAAHPGTVQIPAAPANPYGAVALATRDDGIVIGTIGDGGGVFVWDAAGHGRLLPDPAHASGGGAIAIGGITVGARPSGHQQFRNGSVNAGRSHWHRSRRPGRVRYGGVSCDGCSP